MVGYIKGLEDLNPVQIERACEITLREVDHMPSVAHIRARLFENPVSEGLDYLNEPPMSEEDRTEALYFSQKVKEYLATCDDDIPIRRLPVFEPATSPRFNINHEAYLTWLAEEQKRDERMKKEGLEPTPRSKEESLAMFYHLPLSERRRLRRKAAWTKKPTNIT